MMNSAISSPPSRKDLNQSSNFDRIHNQQQAHHDIIVSDPVFDEKKATFDYLDVKDIYGNPIPTNKIDEIRKSCLINCRIWEKVSIIEIKFLCK